MKRNIYRFFAEGHPIDVSVVEQPLPMSSEAEQKVLQTIENPDLLLTNDVRAYRDLLRQHGLCFDQPDLPKCSARAAKHRCDGNLLYAKKEYGEAMKKYNESICCAPNDSEDLGIGYANRSAIFYEYGDYILALANIQLAKKHNYPKRLMPKLITREANCKEAIDKHNPNENVMMPTGLDLSPFLSDGICVRKLPSYNNSLVAMKNFEAGDLILQEKPLMVAVDESRRFCKCNHCRSDNLVHLIPCPNCTSAMFCNEKCLQDGQTVHRFECGITGELSKLKNGCLGARMFFHGLALFDDDVNKMMAFCRTAKATENSFLDIDYGNYDPMMKEFEIFLAVKPETNASLDRSIRLHAAIVHAMLWNVPSVRVLITNSEQDDFMLQCFAEYMQKAVSMSIRRSPQLGIVCVLYPMASLCNHSCDPNTVVLDYGGQLKLKALRPIGRGEQISIPYGAYPKQEASERQLGLAALGFKCICDVCDVQKQQERLAKRRYDIKIDSDWITLGLLATNHEINYADREKALQQFVQRHVSSDPWEHFASVMKLYANLQTITNTLKMNAIMRAMIAG